MKIRAAVLEDFAKPLVVQELDLAEAAGDHVVTLFSPQCRECIHCRSGKTNICIAIREQQNQGHLPDGTTRLSRDGEPIRHFMGFSTFAEYTVMPEIALAKVDRRPSR